MSIMHLQANSIKKKKIAGRREMGIGGGGWEKQKKAKNSRLIREIVLYRQGHQFVFNTWNSLWLLI